MASREGKCDCLPLTSLKRDDIENDFDHPDPAGEG